MRTLHLNCHGPLRTCLRTKFPWAVVQKPFEALSEFCRVRRPRISGTASGTVLAVGLWPNCSLDPPQSRQFGHADAATSASGLLCKAAAVWARRLGRKRCGGGWLGGSGTEPGLGEHWVRVPVGEVGLADLKGHVVVFAAILS